MSKEKPPHTVIPFPPIRRATIDLLKAAKRKNMIHGMVEIDVSNARSMIHEINQKPDQHISFTAFIISCVSKAVGQNKHIHAYRNWKNQLVLFDEVDVSTTIEREVEGKHQVIPRIIRAANHKTVAAISRELKLGKSGNIKQAGVFNSIRLYLAIPAFIRRLVFRLLDRFPHLMKRKAGTVMVTSVGMMLGGGAGWGIPIASHTVNLTIGSIVHRPVVRNGKVEDRAHLCLTISVDHDLVDGAPVARFVRELKKLMESGSTLWEDSAYWTVDKASGLDQKSP